jgi:hypothetical protein
MVEHWHSAWGKALYCAAGEAAEEDLVLDRREAAAKQGD